MYRVKFEGYLDNNEFTYDYSKYPTIRVSGRDFHNNSGFVQVPEEMPDDGSDQARANAFLWDRGYEYPGDGMFQRMIWLWDEASRNELMIIYMEDLGQFGYAAADFEPGGKAFNGRDSVASELLGRALAGMRFREQAAYPGE